MNIVKEQKGTVLVVRLTGSIEESVNFDQMIGPPPAEIHIYSKEVPRINSVGIKAWIKYFQTAQAKGTKLRFIECSTAIVEQINLISNFTCGGVVESVYVPFSCTNCKSELIGLYKTDGLKKQLQEKGEIQLAEQKCGKCGGKAVFDDIPEEYFRFLTR